MRIFYLYIIIFSVVFSNKTVAQTSFVFPDTLPIIDRFTVITNDTLKVDKNYRFKGTGEFFFIISKDSIGNINNYKVETYKKDRVTYITYNWNNIKRREAKIKKRRIISTTFYSGGQIESRTKSKIRKVAIYNDMCGGFTFQRYVKRFHKKKCTFYGINGNKIKTEVFYRNPKTKRKR